MVGFLVLFARYPSHLPSYPAPFSHSLLVSLDRWLGAGPCLTFCFLLSFPCLSALRKRLLTFILSLPIRRAAGSEVTGENVESDGPERYAAEEGTEVE